MADSAVSFLLQTLGSLMQQEISLLRGLHDEVDDIQHELQSMQSFLKDADKRKGSDDGVKTWVGQVREVTYKVEDIIDEYMYHIAKEDRGGRLLRRVLYETILLPKRYIYKHQIATELQKIKYQIHAISERRNRHGLLEEGSASRANGNGENWERSREYARLISDVDIVGIEKNKKFLISRLIDEVPGRVVLSVVGMGGLGRTTLVSEVYSTPEVKNHFNCHAWITVSQSYEFDELLRNMIRELYKSTKEPIPNGVGEMKSIDLMQLLIGYLQTKRYIIVLDDVWKPIVWQHIQLALPGNGCGGRVMITTRMDDVASSFGVENVLRLKPLDNDDALVLFCNKLFSNKTCPLGLKPHAESLVQKCEGLPLAIVTIGGLMSTKEKSSLEWRKVENNLSWQLSNNEDLGGLKNILLLSFNDLPYNLKYCFLYCSLFPEDYLIGPKRLIRLWVAQSFIEERGRLTPEEVGADNIKDLICRSMLQIVEDDGAFFQKKLRMHDVLRELAISISNEENFCNINDREEEIRIDNVRHLSMHNSIINIQSTTYHRSLMLFEIEISSLSLHSVSSRFKLLRVLHLENSSIESVPDELVELFNLRYLSLRGTNVEELPKSMGRLKNLQTLDIRNSKVKILPRGVEKLKKLRHMLTYGFDGPVSLMDHLNFPEAPNGICNLNCLQSLHCIGANNDIVRKVGNLTQLRKLAIAKVKRHHGKELRASIQRMDALLYLYVKAINEEEILDLEALSSPPAHLENLILVGHLQRLPPWIGSLQNLALVSLKWSQLDEDPLSSLQALPNLERLLLRMAYVGQELCFSCGGFLKLKLLWIGELPKLNQIKIENKSMPCIQCLDLVQCPELQRIPEGIQYLTSLQELYLHDMSAELIGRIKEERVNLQHIPKIGHFNSSENCFERLY